MKKVLALSYDIHASRLISAATLLCLLFFAAAGRSAAQTSDHSQPAIGGTNIFVNTALGGFILGYDIDQTGKEGVLAESFALPGLKQNVAVETFDQKTGKIIKIVIQQMDTKNDFVSLGIVGSSVALLEFEHVTNLYVDGRKYGTINPVDSNKIGPAWTPPLTTDDIISSVSEDQGQANTAIMFFDNTGNTFNSWVFSSNVAANTFGTPIEITNSVFNFDNPPVMAYDSATNQAVLGGSNGCFGCTTEIGLVDLATGAQSSFEGLGFGFINGIAVDPATGIACTTTEDDFSVEFYNLATQTGTIVQIPGANDQSQSGQDVQFDPIHKWFLVGQEFSSTAPSGSSIQVFDEQGNYIESVNGLSLPASPVLIALHPSSRAGYVLVTPALTQLQQFRY
jgi:hypothetical protein